MFKSSRWAARARARIAFGTLLVLGAGRMIVIALTTDTNIHTAHLARALGEGWLVATLGALVVYRSTRHARAGANPGRLFVASFVLPAIGVALMLPLAVHTLFLGMAMAGGFTGIDEWLALGMLFAGLAHLVFALTLALRAADLARGRIKPLSIGGVYFWTVLAGSLPFPILPSVLVAITGLPILPLLFAMKPYVERERTAAGEAELPEAVVVDALHAA